MLAAGIHVILFIINIIFWKAYASGNIVTMGYVATIAHAVFISIESGCYFILRLNRNMIK